MWLLIIKFSNLNNQLIHNYDSFTGNNNLQHEYGLLINLLKIISRTDEDI